MVSRGNVFLGYSFDNSYDEPPTFYRKIATKIKMMGPELVIAEPNKWEGQLRDSQYALFDVGCPSFDLGYMVGEAPNVRRHVSIFSLSGEFNQSNQLKRYLELTKTGIILDRTEDSALAKIEEDVRDFYSARDELFGRHLTTGQVAEILGFVPATVSRKVDLGHINGFRIPGSRHRRVSYESLVEHMKENGMPLSLIDDYFYSRIMQRRKS